MFDSPASPASSAPSGPPTALLPGWLSPGTAQAIQTTIDQFLASGADAEAARAAAMVVALARHPALSMALIAEAVLALTPPR